MGQTLEEKVIGIRFEMQNAEKAEKQVRSVGTQIGNLDKKQKSVNTNTKKGIDIFKNFKVQMLGVMFFGRYLAQTFTGLLQPALNAYGVFDLLSNMFLVTLGPAVNQLINPLVQMFDGFASLPDALKLAIGDFVLLGAAIGGILTVIGGMSSGLSVIAGLFGGAATAAAETGAAVEVTEGFFASLGVGALAVGAVIAVVAYGIYDAWQKNLANIQGWGQILWDSLKQGFNGLIQVFTGIWDIITGLFTGNGAKIEAGFGLLLKGLINFIEGLVQSILSLLIIVGIGVFDIFKNIISAMFKIGVDIMTAVGNGIESMASVIGAKIWNALPSWLQDLLNMAKSGLSSIASPVKSGGIASTAGMKHDFVYRPGQGAQSIDPGDTLVGFKNQPPNLGGGGGINFTANYNLSGVGSKQEIQRMLDDNNRKVVEDVRRLVRV